MPFAISPVNPLVTPGFEIMLSPFPTVCMYPGTMAGEKIETADGHLIVQQPSADARTRSWVWKGFPGFLVQYERQFQLLQTFRARYRQEAGLSPYVWVQDTVTRKLRRRVAQTATVAAGGTTNALLTFTGTIAVVSDAVVEVLPATVGGTGTGAGQVLHVQAMTTSTLTPTGTFATVPTGALVSIQGWVDDWFRVRVLDVNRLLREEGGNVRYETTTLEFVVEDPAYNDLG